MLYRKFPYMEEAGTTSEGAGAGGAGGGGQAGGSKEKSGEGDSFSQEKVNEILARERRKWDQKWESKFDMEKAARENIESNYSTLKSDFDSLRQILEEAAAEVEEEQARGPHQSNPDSSGDPLLDEFEATLRVPPNIKDKEAYLTLKKNQFIQERRFKQLSDLVKEQNKTLEELRTRAEIEQRAREQAEAARTEALRDSELNAALVKNRCLDPENASYIFRPRITWDDKAGSFRFRTKDGQMVSISEGVAAELPPYLVQPQANGGGSGASGARSVTTDQQLTQLKARMDEAESAARSRPNDSRALSQYQVAKREYQEAAKQKGATA